MRVISLSPTFQKIRRTVSHRVRAEKQVTFCALQANAYFIFLKRKIIPKFMNIYFVIFINIIIVALRCDIPVVLVKLQNYTEDAWKSKNNYIYIYIYIYIQRMMVTAKQLHVSASNRPSSGCKSNEKGWGLYNIQFNFCLMTRSRSL